MIRSRMVFGFTGLLAAALFIAAFESATRTGVGQATNDSQDAAGLDVVPMPRNLVGLEFSLGLKDTNQATWKGDVQVSAGDVIDVEVVRAARNPVVDGNRFTVKTARKTTKKRKRKKKQNRVTFLGPVVRVKLNAPPDATVTAKLSQGDVRFSLADLSPGKAKQFLNGHVSVRRHDGVVRLTGRSTEDDFPVLARGKDGATWLAYVEYKPGRPIISEQVEARDFASLVTTGHGDRIRLRRFDGNAWQPPMDVTGGGLDVWRPTVTVDGAGGVVVCWAEKKNGNWDVFSRRLDPAGNAWSETHRISTDSGTDFHVVSTTDSTGTVWIAWQGWRSGHFDILLSRLDANGKPTDRQLRWQGEFNHWGPALAADDNGNIYLAWDCYVDGNYDVQLAVVNAQGKRELAIANTPRFEARPSLVCDAVGRVWIAYEQGDEQWGKDYEGTTPERIGLENLGFGLYVNRTVKVKCLVDGKLQKPAGSIEDAFQNTLGRNKSLPRLAVDAAGGLWLLLRHHPQSGGGGEAWVSFATRYDGAKWSQPRQILHSSNILDNRPALLPHDGGILAVYSGDTRTNTRSRDQDDLFATVLRSTGDAQEVQLAADVQERAAAVKSVHPNEAEAVARIRKYRVKVGGKSLRLLRGEFHRHTEYTAHRDQDGLLEDSWRYALDAGKMDWMGNGDHDNGFGHEYLWWQIQKICDLYHNPPNFIAAMTYERSVVYPSGHRNVMFARRGIRPLPRLTGDDRLFGTEAEGAPDIKLLYAYLKHFGGICAEHTSGTNMGTDWRDNDPEVEPIVEIYQGHRHNYEHFGAPRAATKDTQIGGYQPAGFVWNALEKGYRLGFQSSSDHVSTHMSYATVLVEDVSRQGIIDAFKKRHCYAATDNILLVVRCGEHLMGDEFTSKTAPTLDITVHGSVPIAKVHVIRDNEYVYTTEPKRKEAHITYTDSNAKAGRISYYYVRAEQADGNLAWGSPMWIRYQP